MDIKEILKKELDQFIQEAGRDNTWGKVIASIDKHISRMEEIIDSLPVEKKPVPLPKDPGPVYY